MPLGMLITSGQSRADYRNGLNLLQSLIQGKLGAKGGFGGRGAPAVAMTDDSEAERGALQDVFPGIECLLCSFHSAQAEWRWLTLATSGVKDTDRQALMRLYQVRQWSYHVFISYAGLSGDSQLIECGRGRREI